MLPPPNPPHQPSVPQRAATLIETDEDIREAQVLRTGQQAPRAPGTAVPAASPRVVCPDRPTQRPPVASLTLFDDGKTDGELLRLRAARFVLGRSEGDFLLPHDEL